MSVSKVVANFKVIHGAVDYQYPNPCFSFSTKYNFKFPKYTQFKMRLKMCASNSGVWGDRFLIKDSNNQFLVSDDVIIKHQQLKEKVRSLLIDGCPKAIQKLELIDAIQRFGINYHFQIEIDEILRKVIEESNALVVQDDEVDAHKSDLYLVSLKFRLLRQNGYNISSDIFDKFKDKEGKLKGSTAYDIKGMLSLYEATHVRTSGEEFLDQALGFTIDHLQSVTTQMSSPFSDQINHALDQPYHLGIPRLEARKYFQFYEGSDSCNKILLSFAKLDFNLLQNQHQGELSDITRWWKELDFAKKLPSTRDRVVECYSWTLGMHFEPHYRLARMIITKIGAISVVLDDIFDLSDAYLEHELFATIIERWELSEVDKLPDYMKEVLKVIIDVYSEIEETLLNQGKPYRFYYAKQSIKDFVRAIFTQSKWLNREYIPTLDEYLNTCGVLSSSYPMVATLSLCGMGDFVTKRTFDWLFSDPKIVIDSSTIGRYMDDIIDRKHENNTDLVASSIDCYMKQYECSEEEAVEELKKQIISLRKEINWEFMQLSSFVPRQVLMMLLNLNRIVGVLYKTEDYLLNGRGVTKDFVSSLLVHPVPM